MNKLLVIVAVGMFLVAAMAAAGAAVKAGGSQPQAIFEAKCSQCHDLNRTLSKRKSAAGWQETVSRMQHHSGGSITDAEAELIIKYLTEIRGS
ncbi:MAG: hypothetical protein JRJ12_03385 [Deltaproteobacteria bacterium]|nr:hypothetical protein [Deltaproteobacteria bacterium]MBW2070272.1 hypothetical protein [Deltaproteobacteria bacterium]